MILKDKITTIIFDVDGTLSEEVSWLKLTQGLGGSPEEHADIFDRFKKGKLTYPEAKRQLILLWQDTGNANKTFMTQMFLSWSLKHDAEETITYLKQNYRVCLMSGAVDLYVKIVAEKIGITDWYANTELIWNEENNLVDFNYHADQAQKKLEHFKDYISKNNIKRGECAIVGDGDSDLALFKELKYGIAVNKDPYPELESLAFKSVKNLIELKKIF
jgi:HAD superfamily phosphoserine phosphatase-like hydrolase